MKARVSRKMSGRVSIILAFFFAFLSRYSAEGAREKRVFAHYLPWYDGKGVRYAKRTGWCYRTTGVDCSDQSVVHYSNEPLIGEYSQLEGDVLEYHLLLMKVSGIDGVIVNINPRNSIQKDIALKLLDKILDMKNEYGGLFDMKVIVSYDDGGRASQSTITSNLQWMYTTIYNNQNYSPLIFRDDETNWPVVITWSESDPAYTWATLQSLFTEPVHVVIRNARKFEYSTANMEWINNVNYGQPMTNTQNWGQRYFNDFDWLMARQSTTGIPVDTVNEVMLGNVYPGFDDQNVPAFWNGGNNRYILRDVDDGETMALTWQRHIDYTPQRLGGPDVVVDPWIQIATWNDWPEGSSVEPATESTYGYRALNTCHEKIAIFKGISPYYAQSCLKKPYEIYQLRKAGEMTSAEEAISSLLQIPAEC